MKCHYQILLCKSQLKPEVSSGVLPRFVGLKDNLLSNASRQLCMFVHVCLALVRAHTRCKHTCKQSHVHIHPCTLTCTYVFNVWCNVSCRVM